MGYLFLQSASCQLAMSKCKSFCVSFNLKAVETAEKKFKEAQQENLACVKYRTIIYILKRRPRFNAGLVLSPGQNLREGNKRPGLYSRKGMYIRSNRDMPHACGGNGFVQVSLFYVHSVQT